MGGSRRERTDRCDLPSKARGTFAVQVRLPNVVRFSSNKGCRGLALTMTSPRWRLEQGRSYPIELAAGSVTWDTKVIATINTVRVALTEPRFTDGLRIADLLEIRGAGSVIRMPLDKSAAAMERLERCYENNRRSTETNPFIAPSRRP